MRLLRRERCSSSVCKSRSTGADLIMGFPFTDCEQFLTKSEEDSADRTCDLGRKAGLCPERKIVSSMEVLCSE
jgi:hypothetical protein